MGKTGKLGEWQWNCRKDNQIVRKTSRSLETQLGYRKDKQILQMTNTSKDWHSDWTADTPTHVTYSQRGHTETYPWPLLGDIGPNSSSGVTCSLTSVAMSGDPASMFWCEIGRLFVQTILTPALLIYMLRSRQLKMGIQVYIKFRLCHGRLHLKARLPKKKSWWIRTWL